MVSAGLVILCIFLEFLGASHHFSVILRKVSVSFHNMPFQTTVLSVDNFHSRLVVMRDVYHKAHQDVAQGKHQTAQEVKLEMLKDPWIVLNQG